MDKVILYSTGCPKCRILEKKLDMANIEYDVNDSVEEMQALGFQELPKLSINGTIYDFIDAVQWLNNK